MHSVEKDAKHKIHQLKTRQAAIDAANQKAKILRETTARKSQIANAITKLKFNLENNKMEKAVAIIQGAKLSLEDLAVIDPRLLKGLAQNQIMKEKVAQQDSEMADAQARAAEEAEDEQNIHMTFGK